MSALLGPLPGSLAVAAIAFVAAPLLARLAPAIGWVDAPTVARKLQRVPVPSVGGAVLLLALVAAPRAATSLAHAPWLDPARAPAAVVAAFVLVFAVGTLDDRLAFRAGPKALLQLASLTPLCLASAQSGASSWLGMLAILGLGCAALNLLNTFDNADGAVLGVSLVGWLFALPALALACLGLLPWNLDAGRRGRRAAGAPTVYLGDAGVNVLALATFLVPAAWPTLWIPALDLARLSWVRWRAGSRPWLGDRRHLAHRMEARGLRRPWVALVLALLAAPACAGAALEARVPGAGPAGLALGAGGFALALLWSGRAVPTRAREEGDDPCPAPSASE